MRTGFRDLTDGLQGPLSSCRRSFRRHYPRWKMPMTSVNLSIVPATNRIVASVRSCTRQYPGVLALDNATFEVAAGEVRALLGKNGAGKSTMIRLLTGAETPDKGTVAIDGMQLNQSGSA